ncbi:MAG: TIR domain-containing protein [Candidatus Binatia bacterium]
MPGKSYAAFISYSHAADGKLAPAIQSALQRFAKPWYRRRSMRVFRDQASLSTNPALWSSIEHALADAEFFILLATPESAASVWVDREIDYWLSHASPDRLLIVLTEGDIAWNTLHQDFDWQRTTALSRKLAGVFREEPLHLDLRWARTESQLSSKHPQFQGAIADLTATVLGKPKDEIIGEDIRQHRRTVRLAWSAATTLAVLAVLAVSAAALFVYQRGVAQRRELEARQHLYTAHINQALIAARAGDMDRAAAILSLQAPEKNPVDLRGFEWHYLWRASHRELAVYRCCGLASIAISPDGRLLAAAGVPLGPPEGETKTAAADWFNRGEIKVWEIASGRQLFSKSHGRRFSAIAFSPDSRLLAAVTQAGGAAILEGNDVLLLHAFTGEIAWVKRETGNLTSVAFHPDGKLIATGGHTISASLDGQLSLWDVAGGSRVALDVGPVGWIRSLAFSPDGTDLAFAWDRGPNSGGAVWVWNLRAQKLRGKLETKDSLVLAMKYSPDGNRMLLGESDGVAVAWNPSKQSEDTVFRGHRGMILSLAVAPANDILATGGGDHSVRLWDRKTGQMIGALPKHGNAVESVAFSPDGRVLATAANGIIKLWSVAEELGYASSLSAHRSRLNAVAFSPNGALLGTGGEEGTVRLWDLGSRKELKHFELGAGSKGVLALAFSPIGKRVATTGNIGTKVWNLETGGIDYADQDSGEALVFLPDGAQLVLANGRGIFRIDLSKRTKIRFSRQRSEAVAISPDGKTLATAWGSAGPSESDVLLWSVSNGQRLCALKGHDQGVLSLSFSPDGTRLASGGYGSYVKIWNVAACNEHATLAERAGSVNSLKFSPDGKTLAVGYGTIGLAEDGSVVLWNTATWEELLTLPAGMRNVRSVAFSPTANMLAAGGDDAVIDAPGKVRFWLADAR